MNISGEQILAVVGLMMALVIWIGGLRDARWWEREQKALDEPKRERKRAAHGGPWGG